MVCWFGVGLDTVYHDIHDKTWDGKKERKNKERKKDRHLRQMKKWKWVASGGIRTHDTLHSALTKCTCIVHIHCSRNCLWNTLLAGLDYRVEMVEYLTLLISPHIENKR